MIELLPFFVAGTALCGISAGAVLGALAKAPLLRQLSGNRSVRLSVGSLCATAASEVAITAISFLVMLSRLGSGAPATEGSAALPVVTLFVACGILSWIVNLLPNLYLLGKASDRSGPGDRDITHPGYALLLALPTPLFTSVLLLLVYFAFC